MFHRIDKDWKLIRADRVKIQMEATGIQRIQVTDLVAQDFLTLFFVQRCFLSDEPVQVILSRTVFKPALEKDTQIICIMFKGLQQLAELPDIGFPQPLKRFQPARIKKHGHALLVQQAEDLLQRCILLQKYQRLFFVAMPVKQAGAKKWKAHHVPLMCGQ